MFNPGDVVVLEFPGCDGCQTPADCGHFLSGLSRFATRSGRWANNKPERGSWTYGLCISGLVAGGLEDSLGFSQFFRYAAPYYPSCACWPSV